MISPDRQTAQGFSLTEILISLAIMGFLATFAIAPLFTVTPQMLSAKYTNRASEAGYVVRMAYQQYKLTHASVPTTMTMDDLLPYLNYSSLDTTSHLDDHVNASADIDCSNTANYTCLVLYGQSRLAWHKNVSFGGKANNNGIYFYLDPNGIRDTNGSADVAGKSLCMYLTYNGRIYSRGIFPASGMTSMNYTGVYPWTMYATGAENPSWFTGF